MPIAYLTGRTFGQSLQGADFGLGEAIGCERCHGPGELHVRGQEVVAGRDLTIVNPRHLSLHSGRPSASNATFWASSGSAARAATNLTIAQDWDLIEFLRGVRPCQRGRDQGGGARLADREYSRCFAPARAGLAVLVATTPTRFHRRKKRPPIFGAGA